MCQFRLRLAKRVECTDHLMISTLRRVGRVLILFVWGTPCRLATQARTLEALQSCAFGQLLNFLAAAQASYRTSSWQSQMPRTRTFREVGAVRFEVNPSRSVTEIPLELVGAAPDSKKPYFVSLFLLSWMDV